MAGALLMKPYLPFVFVYMLLWGGTYTLSEPPTSPAAPAPQIVGRIAISSDGNNHDCDDITATAMSIALLAKTGNASKLVYYGHSDHHWSSNTVETCGSVTDREAEMHISSHGTAQLWGGFTLGAFRNVRANLTGAVNALVTQVNNSSAGNPLTIIAAGPMDVVGRALNTAGANKDHVTVISHSDWNDNHSDSPENESSHSGWTWAEMQAAFPTVTFTHIADQNAGLTVAESNYFWLRDSSDSRLQSIWARHVVGAEGPTDGHFDPSDAGMVYYLLTGDQGATPRKIRFILEPTIYPNATWDTATPVEMGFDDGEFATALAALPDKSIVIRNGYVVGTKGSETATGYVWSVSKSLVSMIYARQLQLGNVAYDNVVPSAGGATFRQFLANTSDFGLSPGTPGAFYAYNNGAWHHMGTHLKTTFYPGRTHVQTLQDAYVTALGFENTLGYNTAGFMSGWDGGWSMSAQDLARIGYLVLRGGSWKGQQLLSASHIDSLYTDQIPGSANPSTDADDQFYNQDAVTVDMDGQFSYGFWLGEAQTREGTGSATEAIGMFGAFGSSVWVSRLHGVVVVNLNSGDEATNPSDRISGAEFDAIINALESSAPVDPPSANTYYARTDGGTSTQCTGTTNAPYPGSGTGQACGYASLQVALDTVAYGDTIIARAGDTWDQISTPAKSGTPSTITVKSSAEASIPIRLHGVINTDATNMAKIATTQNNYALSIPSGRSHWNFIGFEITTANRSQYYSILVDHIGSNVNFDRCWIHSLEDYTNDVEASTRIGMNYAGSNSTITNSRIAYFSAYVLNTTIVDNNFAIIYSGSTLTVSNSFLGAWFNAIITGGSSFAPDHTATISGSPTTTSATLSNVSGLSVGMLMALRNYQQRVLTNACSFTASTKTLVCSGGNFTAAYQDWMDGGGPRFFFPNLGAGGNVATVVNSTTAIMTGALTGSDFSNQTVEIDGVYGAVKITGISGNNVTFTPWGVSGLKSAPEVPGNVQWGPGHVPNNLAILRTMVYNNPTIAHAVQAQTGNNPKAFWEVKAIDGMLVDGCVFSGFGTSLGYLVANQGTPQGCPSVWSKIDNVTISNNWYNTIPNQFQTMGFALSTNYYCTSSGGSNINVFNNLFTAGAVLARFVAGTNVQFRHNTAINDDLSSGAQLLQQEAESSATDTHGFVYSDNIAYQNTYGINCSYGVALGCVPSPVITTNLFIGPLEGGPYCGSGYPAGNVCVANQAAVKFTDAANNNYRLAFDSPGKGTGTGNSDMGVDWQGLVNALGFDPSGITTPVTPPRIRGRGTLNGRARVGE